MRKIKVIKASYFLFFYTNVIFGNQNPSNSQSQKSALQIEQQEMGAKVKYLLQPEVRRERELLDNINSAMEEYYKNKDESSRNKYEALYKQALELPKPSVSAYSACATAANLLDEPQKAIAILKKAIIEYPDEQAWGPKVPLKISGYYRIGSIALRMNDPKEAIKAYENVIKNCQNIESSEFIQILSLMHIVDIESNQLKNKKLALNRLAEVNKSIDLIDPNFFRSDYDKTIKLLKGWISYEQELIETGKYTPLQKTDLSKEEYTSPYMFSMIHVTLSHTTTPEMEQAASSEVSSFESVLNKIAFAFAFLHETDYRQQLSENLPKAEQYIQDIIKTDPFFKPYAEALLDILNERKEKYKD